MNILLWILQVLLALWNITGGLFTLSHYDELKGGLGNDLPQAIWVAIATLQALFALGLVLPGALRKTPKITVIAAVYLTANSLLGCAIFAKYDGFPGLLWGVVPALLTASVAYGRSAHKRR